MGKDADAEVQSNVALDAAAGWAGGVTGIIVSNPFEVVKVRLQTWIPPASSRVGAGSRAHLNRAPDVSQIKDALQKPEKPGFKQLWRTEGSRLFFAGSLFPILGLALIDSTFFSLYGRAMSTLNQSRENPTNLNRVFASGALAGGICALLQTPIEVIKVRDQNDKTAKPAGSIAVCRSIFRDYGIRGFYVGLGSTIAHDVLASGIFFSTYFALRRLMRPSEPKVIATDFSEKVETLAAGEATSKSLSLMDGSKIFVAGGVAGVLSAVLTYPLDMIKTRLQTTAIDSQMHPTAGSKVTVRQIITRIYRDQKAYSQLRYRQSTTWRALSFIQDTPTRSLWALRLIGCKGFIRGLRPTVLSSFIGSSATILVVETITAAFST